MEQQVVRSVRGYSCLRFARPDRFRVGKNRKFDVFTRSRQNKSMRVKRETLDGIDSPTIRALNEKLRKAATASQIDDECPRFRD